MKSTRQKKGSGGAGAFHLLQVATFEKLAFLIDLYGFKRIATNVHMPECTIRYRNDTTGVTVFYDLGSSVWITLSRLINERGEVVEGETYGLHLLAMERCPADLALQEDDSKEHNSEFFGKTLERLANLLRKCGDDVLRGDFKVFPRLRVIAEAERRRLNKELFGSESGETI